MKELITKEILEEYGFKISEAKSKDRISVFIKNKIDIILFDGGSVYYSNMGFDYILKDESDLKKLYEELRREELKKQ